MKKLASLFLCFAILFSFVGCNTIEKQNEVAKEYLNKVLEKEQSFTYKCLVFDKVTDENLQKFVFNTESSALISFDPLSYTYLDFDHDGVEELFVVDARLSYFLILKYDGEKVVGYMMADNVDLQHIKTNGTFLKISYVFDDDFKIIGKNFSVCEVEFDGLDHRVNTLASQNQKEDIYKIGEQSATKDEVEAYIDNWKNNNTQIEWCTIGD